MEHLGNSQMLHISGQIDNVFFSGSHFVNGHVFPEISFHLPLLQRYLGAIIFPFFCIMQIQDA